jgi:hypothetical protein
MATMDKTPDSAPDNDPLCDLLNADTKAIQWTGHFSDFVMDNRELTMGEIEAAAVALTAGRSWAHGGGAAGGFILQLKKSK